MKILFLGDSITDGERNRDKQGDTVATYGIGTGFVNAIASELVYSNPNEYEIINTGIGGDTILQLNVRIKKDCWNYKPDVINMLVGVNDVFQGIYNENGTGIDRFEETYRSMINYTQKELPNAKIIICEPFIQRGSVTNEHYDYAYKTVREFAQVIKKLAKEYNLPFVELQKPLDDYAEKYGEKYTLADGVHPAIAGARVIANEWLKVFREKIDK